MSLGKIILWHVMSLLLFVALMFVAQMIWPEVRMHDSFSCQAASLFLILSFLITWMSNRLINHKNPYYFSYVTLLSVLVKLGLGIALVAIYTKTREVEGKLYIIPFILSYLIFTICEVALLQIIIQSAKKTWSK